MLEMKQTFVYLLIALCQYFINNASALMEVDSLQMVSCENKQLCYNGINLRIVLNASAIESLAGWGGIAGAVAAGHEWTDSFGTWKLGTSLNIAINYSNVAWEYQLLDQGEFPSYQEMLCQENDCDGKSVQVCPEGNGFRFRFNLLTKETLTKYAVQEIEKWKASVSIQSPAMNIEWSANNAHPSMLDSDIEIYMEPIFDADSCYQDLGNLYNVVADKHPGNYYWTSKQYWQDKRNNFNISMSTYVRDFDCGWDWEGWHTIIPFYNNTDKYLDIVSANQFRLWKDDQLYMWKEDVVDAYFYNIMENCTDLTTYTLTSKQQPVGNLYKATKLGIVDHFRVILDLNYKLLIDSDPTFVPSQSPTSGSPTTLLPSQSPTLKPVIPPTRAPSSSPTVCIDNNPWEYYETAAKIEITSTSAIDISSPTVLANITESLASGLDIGTEYIRLDFAEYMTSISRRRLQTNTQILILGFTVFASTEDGNTMLKEKLEATLTYYLIDSALSDKFPEIIFTFISSTMDECEAGTKLRTVAGQRQCESICAVNHYYDTSSSSCEVQVEFSTIKIIKKNYLVRILFFGIGIIAWIATLGLGYAVHKCYKNKSQPGTNVKSSDTKSNIKSTHDAESDFEESEYSSTNDEDYSTTNDSSSPNSSSTSSS